MGIEPSPAWTMALSKLDPNQIKKGIAETVRQGIAYPPNLPKFVSLCENFHDDSFDRFISRQPLKDRAEILTDRKVGWECRTQLPAERARRLWNETIRDIRRQLANGSISKEDPAHHQIESPERVKENLTPSQRDQRLDRQIDEMIAKGIPLIGPFKKRYEERSHG